VADTKTGEHAADCLDPPVEHGGILPDLTAGALGRPGLPPVRPDLGRVDTLRCDEAAAIAGRPKSVAVGQRGWSAPCSLASAKFPNPYRQFFTGRCASRATPGGGAWGITATAWLAAEDPLAPLARLHDVHRTRGWFYHSLVGVCSFEQWRAGLLRLARGKHTAPLWSSQRPRKPLRRCPNVPRPGR
jgi:hypothetical protein